MNDSAAGAPTDGSGSDLGSLPPDLARQSLSNTVIILPLDAALKALAHYAAQGRRLEAWEGWVKMKDGGRARSLAHGGSFALPRDPARAAETGGAAMRKAQETWQRIPEYPGAALYFELTFSKA